jgi:RimJ/RimL family protein N-acetyltransferase
MVCLVCAEENLPAMKLYDKLGFSLDEVKEVWYSMK